MGSYFSRLAFFETPVDKKIPMLHRPTTLSGTHDEITEAVRYIDSKHSLGLQR